MPSPLVIASARDAPPLPSAVSVDVARGDRGDAGGDAEDGAAPFRGDSAAACIPDMLRGDTAARGELCAEPGDMTPVLRLVAGCELN